MDKQLSFAVLGKGIQQSRYQNAGVVRKYD